MSKRVLAPVGIALAVAMLLFARSRRPEGLRGRPEPPLALETEAVQATKDAHGKDAAPALDRDTTPNAERSAEGSRSATATLLVRVVSDEASAAMAGVRIYAMPRSAPFLGGEPIDGSIGRVGEVPRTGADGRAQLEVESGAPLSITAQPSGDLGRARVELAPLARGERRELELRIPTQPGRAFVLRAVESESGAPIAGARAALFLPQWAQRVDELARSPWDAELETRTTDEQGYLELRVRSWDALAVGVDAPDRPRRYVRVGAGHEARDSAYRIALTRAASLRARIAGTVDAELIATIDGWRLFEEEGHSAHDPLPEIAWSAPVVDGVALLDALPPRVPLHVELVSKGGRASSVVDGLVLEPGETRELDIDPSATARVHGRAVDQRGQPIGDQELWIVRDERPWRPLFSSSDQVTQRATTAADGSFAIEALEPGAWWIGAAPLARLAKVPAEERVDSLARPFAIDAGMRELELEFVLDRGLYLRGRVVAPDGSGVGDALVTAKLVGADLPWSASSLDDGRFDLGPLAAGDCELHAMDWKHAPSRAVFARAGAEDVVLALERGSSIAGRVATREGESAGSVALVLGEALEDEGADGWTQRLHAEGDGAFAIEGLAAGVYALLARDASEPPRAALAERIALAPGQHAEGVELVLERAGELRVASTASVDLELRVLRGNCLLEDDLLSPSAPFARSLPPGHWVVQLRNRKNEVVARRDVELRAGELVELPLP